MRLAPKSIEVGKCYATKHNELRQVVSVAPNGMVTYDTGKKADDGGWSSASRFNASLENFAREAVSEAPCP
jgi:hypothetical protein